MIADTRRAPRHLELVVGGNASTFARHIPPLSVVAGEEQLLETLTHLARRLDPSAGFRRDVLTLKVRLERRGRQIPGHDVEPLFSERQIRSIDGSVIECLGLRPDLAARGLSFPNACYVHAAGIQTLGDLRRSIEDESLLSVRLIGPVRFAEIKQAVMSLYAAHGGDA
jgi:hypothetical protein